MSGTSLDGVDAALITIEPTRPNEAIKPSSDAASHVAAFKILHTHAVSFPAELRQQLLTLHHPSKNELEVTALTANELARLYAKTVNELLAKHHIKPAEICAIGCHGQTIRHRPELGFTLQIGNAALLAELTNITVVSDFRSRDIAAGGQGAPLVPAFHQAVFAHKTLHRVVINIGGIANLTNLPTLGFITGFDTGPGNMLMDAWALQHLGVAFDESGRWAATGQVIPHLLNALLAHPYFKELPPKSTGRDLFNMAWLQTYLKPGYSDCAANDVQRTLLAFSAITIADAVKQHCGKVDEIYLCGGGAHNHALIECLIQLLPLINIAKIDELGISVNWVEAAAFGWLARQAILQATSSLPEVTGAKGARVLGAIYAK